MQLWPLDAPPPVTQTRTYRSPMCVAVLSRITLREKATQISAVDCSFLEGFVFTGMAG